jgi:hypothetical protein
MRIRKSCFILGIAALISGQAYPQKNTSAVMNVSANVISGSSISNIDFLEINLKKENSNFLEYDFTPPRNIETQVNSDSSFVLTNQFGETITLESDSSISSDLSSQSVNLKVILAESDLHLRGQYQGNLLSSISYF